MRLLVGVAFCGFLLRVPHGHPFWFSRNQGTASCHPIGFCRHIGPFTVHGLAIHGLSSAIPDFHSLRLYGLQAFRLHTGLTVHGFAVDGLSAVILDFPQSTALSSMALHSLRLYGLQAFRLHTGLRVNGLSTVIPDLQSTAFPPLYQTFQSPRPFRRHTGLSTVHGVSAVHGLFFFP